MRRNRSERRTRECPYPGPRPLNREEDGGAPWRFVGRRRLVDDIVSACKTNAHVVVHGLSGAGKSSLLDMKVVPFLRGSKRVVLVMKEWPSLGDDFDAFLGQQILATPWMPEQVKERVRGGDDPLDVLEQSWPGMVVLILDQFEELIRGHPSSYRTAAEFIERATGDRRRGVTTVLSLRSEYLHRMTEIHTPPGSTLHIEVTPVLTADEVKAAALLAGAPDEVREQAAMDEPAGEWFSQLWAEASWNGKSVLDLQATLYDLWSDRRKQKKPLGELEVRRLFTQDGSKPTSHDIERMLDERYSQVIGSKLTAAKQAFLDGDGSPPAGAAEQLVLPTAALNYIRGTAARLSSGGFKLDLRAWDVFRQLCDWEIRAFAFAMSVAEKKRWESRVQAALAQALESAARGTVPPTGLLRAGALPASPERRKLNSWGIPAVPWLDDKAGLSSGPVMGLGADEV
ncbi:MAG: hypothetical protein LBH76_09035, partial [Propionibacteriaceae bacterium]|nr:hypothetical protein [Propionibacteriaceae bacterium]